MNLHRFWPFQVSVCTAVVLAALVTFSWNRSAFCGEIHEAAFNGELARVRALLTENPSLVFSKDHQGSTPLHQAADGGHEDVAELLLAKGADISARDDAGKTPLLYAANRGSKQVVELFLAKGADVNAKDNTGCTPLHDAVTYGGKDVTELLLAKGADVNARDNDGETPLLCAVKNGGGTREIVALLLARGADANAKNKSGTSPLDWEKSTTAGTDGQSGGGWEWAYGGSEIFQLMTQKGYDQSPIVKSGFAGKNVDARLAAVETMTDQALLANIAEEDIEENVRFAAAGKLQNPDVLDRVGAANAPNENGRMQTIIALRHLLAESGIFQEPVLIGFEQKFLSVEYSGFEVHGERVEVSILTNERTVLAHETFKTEFPSSVSVDKRYIAANVDLTKFLIDRFESEHYSPSQIQTTLAKVAAQDTHEEVWGKAILTLAQDLLPAFTLAQLKNDLLDSDRLHPASPMHVVAAYNELSPIAELLLANHAKVNVKSPWGDTPLHVAAEKGNKHVVELLVANGAEVNAKDNHGRTPLDWASGARADTKDVTEFLRQHGGR